LQLFFKKNENIFYSTDIQIDKKSFFSTETHHFAKISGFSPKKTHISAELLTLYWRGLGGGFF